VNLANCPLGTLVVITGVNGSVAERLRFAELGLSPGSTAAALLSGFGKRRVIRLGTQRIAFAPQAAGKISVELVEPETVESAMVPAAARMPAAPVPVLAGH